MDRFTGELDALSGNVIDALCNAVPQEFGGGHLDKIAVWLREASRGGDQLVAEIRRLLQ